MSEKIDCINPHTESILRKGFSYVGIISHKLKTELGETGTSIVGPVEWGPVTQKLTEIFPRHAEVLRSSLGFPVIDYRKQSITVDELDDKMCAEKIARLEMTFHTIGYQPIDRAP